MVVAQLFDLIVADGVEVADDFVEFSGFVSATDSMRANGKALFNIFGLSSVISISGGAIVDIPFTPSTFVLLLGDEGSCCVFEKVWFFVA